MSLFSWFRKVRPETGASPEAGAGSAEERGAKPGDSAAEGCGAKPGDGAAEDCGAQSGYASAGECAPAPAGGTENTGPADGERTGETAPETEQTEKMYIIAGLGNPGRKYEKTRHNCGFEALDILADRARIAVTTPKFHALCGTGVIDGQKVLLIKPQTYMNLSGQAVQAACAYYKADPAEQLIVLYDDISLEPGQLRVRAKGSAGGHNGIKSIIQMLGTDRFLRIRIGTGRQPSDYQQVDWVLGHFPPDQRADMEDAFDRAARAAQALLTEDPEQVMSLYNRRQEKE